MNGTIIENLPAKLREEAVFCCFNLEKQKGSPKPKKMPYNPRTGRKARSTCYEDFAPLSVVASFQEKYSGIGLGIFGDIAAIDIDNCVDENRALSEMANSIVEIMNCYTEISPSGHGLRLIFRASGFGGEALSQTTNPSAYTSDLEDALSFNYNTSKYYINNGKRGLEVYVGGVTNKYVTLTGQVIHQMDLVERSGELRQVLDLYMRRETAMSTKEKGDIPQLPDLQMDDAELIKKIKRSNQALKFSKLWDGDMSDYDDDHSRADLALCSILAYWTRCKAEWIDRLFRQSGLIRSKWDEKRGSDTYGEITIQKAISSSDAVYDTDTYFSATLDDFGHSSVPICVKPADLSDSGNAAVFTSEYREELIYVDALGWLFWNGACWERSDHKALQYAMIFSQKMLDDALMQHNEAMQKEAGAKSKFGVTGADEDETAVKIAKIAVKEADEYLKHAKSTRNAARIKAMLELSISALVIKADMLDANPFDFNTPAGLVDLRSGQIRPHDRKAYCSRIASNAPGNAGEAEWQEFLDTVTCGDEGTKKFIQQVMGMAAIGKVFHEGIIIAEGGGRNGKSTLFNAIGNVFGDYRGGIKVDVLTTSMMGNKGAALATLRGKRLVLTGELEEGQRLSIKTIKEVASTDELNIEEKYRSPELIKQSHTVCMFTNHLPRVGSNDEGTWRRLIIVPFTAVIPSNGGIQNYADVLAENAGEAIMSWIVDGAVKFCQNNFKLDVPKKVQDTTDGYRQNEDWINNFMSEQCVRGENERVGARDLYMAYVEWSKTVGDYTRRERDFSAAMEAAGFKKIAPGNKKFWTGLRLHWQRPCTEAFGATG